jgi:hypothetical protein
MLTRLRTVLCVGALSALAGGVGSAVADNGLHLALGKPVSTDSTMTISPTSIEEGSSKLLTFTFTMGSTPSTIANGEVEAEAPDGWTITNAVVNTSTCDTTNAVISFTSSNWEVDGVSCATGQTLVVDATATTPDVSAETLYSFDSSFKTSPGSRRWNNNVYKTQSDATVTVTVAI